MTKEEREETAQILFIKARHIHTGWDTGKPDTAGAISWYEKAIKLGHVKAMMHLGNIYSQRKEYENAYYWFLEAALAGSGEGICSLGIMYHLGRLVDRDFKKAYGYFTLAYKQGVPEACYYLGNYASLGYFGVHDTVVAARYYQEGMEKGCIACATSLAIIYGHGAPGLPANPKKEFELNQFAADRDDGTACHNLGLCYEFGRGVKPDMKKALLYYRKGATLGSPCCIKKLERLKEKGVI